MSTKFRFLKVESPALLKEVFRLRFQVYCLECGFLDPGHYPDGLETDQYDSHSIHFAALDHLDKVVGSIRLIRNSEPTPFPIEVHCQPILETNSFFRENIAEISRLAVSKNFRRREDDNFMGTGAYLPKETLKRNVLELKDFRRKRPEIVLGLYKMMYHESKRLGLTHWFAVMEAKLWEVLNRQGIQFIQIGKKADYYGPVNPYWGAISDLEKHIFNVNPQLYYNYFLEGLEPCFWPYKIIYTSQLLKGNASG